MESDEHFYHVNRYVERNALRANLVKRAEKVMQIRHQELPSLGGVEDVVERYVYRGEELEQEPEMICYDMRWYDARVGGVSFA